MGEAVGSSAAKLFLVGGGEGTSVRTTASWGGVVRCLCVNMATVKSVASSNEDRDKRDRLS